MVIEVADANAIPIPRFCYHHKLTVAANCRMCLVEVEQAPKPLPACATPVMEGMLAPAARIVVPLPALAGARGAGPGALRGEPRRVRSEAMSEYAQKRRRFFRQPIFGSGYAGLGDIQSSSKSKIPFSVLSKRSAPSRISVAVFSNTKMSLKVGGRRSRSRSWEVSEWKGDVEVHEGPVQALIGLEPEG